jgi:hypothetical protein
MTQNYSIKIYNCEFCDYTTIRRFNLIRHQNAIHNNIENKKRCIKISRENVSPVGENVSPVGENVNPVGENVNPVSENVSPKFICKKCNKIYNTNRYLIEHEKKCTGVDDLTCPRCMISFTTRQAKSKHIIKNNCKPRSIIHARIPNSKIIETVNNITNNVETYNNYNYTNNITNNLIINNYGDERIDYLNYEKMLEIFKKAYDIPSLLTKEIHFNNEFPENNNILYKNENTSLIKSDDEFILKGLNNLVLDLIEEKSKLMQKFAIENKEDICLKMDSNIYEDIIELLIKLILLKEPSEHYKKQVNCIRDMIKNSSKV